MTIPSSDFLSAPFTVKDRSTGQLNAGMTEEGRLFIRDDLPPERKRQIIRDFFRAREALQRKQEEAPTERRGHLLRKLDQALSRPSPTATQPGLVGA